MTPEWLGAGQHALEVAVGLAPSLLGALALSVVGLVVAWVARRATVAGVRRSGLEGFAERHGVVQLLYGMRIRSGLALLLGNLVATAVLLVTGMSVAETVGLPGVAEGISTVVEFLPRVVAASVVAAVGFAVADLVRRFTDGVAGRRDDLVAPGLPGTVLYYLVLAVFFTTAVQQLGLDTGLVDTLLVLVVGVAAGSAGLSLALGSRYVVEDVLARQYLQQVVRVGDEVEAGDVRGVVVGYDSLTVSVRSADGSLHLLRCRHVLDGGGVRILPGAATSASARRDQ
jgi:small-conductance mechanosensitive channel